MKPILQLVISIMLVTASAQAQTPVFFGANPRDTPQSVPEPSSPLAMLVSAAMALVTRRKRGRGRWIRERRIDLRTVEFP